MSGWDGKVLPVETHAERRVDLTREETTIPGPPISDPTMIRDPVIQRVTPRGHGVERFTWEEFVGKKIRGVERIVPPLIMSVVVKDLEEKGR